MAIASVLVLGLFACADIAGLEEPVGNGAGTQAPDRSSPPGNGTPLPTDGVTEKDKANTDSDNPGELSIATSGIDFGQVLCGSVGEQNIVLSNSGSNAINYAIVMPEDSVFVSVNPLSGTIAANGNVVLKFTARPVIAGVTKANVVITSGARYVTIPIGVVGAGATLEWASVTADIGETRINTDGLTRVKLRNVGSASAKLTGFESTTTDFKAALPIMPFDIGVEKEVEVDLTLLKSGVVSASQLSAQITPKAQGVCSAPQPIKVTGKRISTDVIVTGGDWGKRECYSKPTDVKTITIKNYFNKQVTWTVPTLTTFGIVGASTGTVDAAVGATPGTKTIEFTAPDLQGPGLVTEPVNVDITGEGLTAPGAGPHPVSLKVDVRGAVVEILPPTLDFLASATSGTSQSKTYQIKNTGNEPAWIAWSFKRTNGQAAWTDLPQETYTSGTNTTSERIRYQPTADPPTGEFNTATLTPTKVSSGKKICNPDWNKIVNLSGTKP